RRQRDNSRSPHMTLEEALEWKRKFVTELRSCPKEEQLAVARKLMPFMPDFGENKEDHKCRFNALSAKEQQLYVETQLSMFLMDPIKNEDKAARVMMKMSSHGAARNPNCRCACSSCRPLELYKNLRDRFFGRDQPAKRKQQFAHECRVH